MGKRKGNSLKDEVETVSLPDTNKRMKKKKMVSKVEAPNAVPPSPAPMSVPPQALVSAPATAARGKEKAKDKSEQLSGFIFMCNAKTKPECFGFRVFGLPAGKRYVLEKIKAGMKLFLFDFDLKLLYGIYKADCHGQLNLEPAAFGGNFPAQVRFSVDKDCLPLPEAAFKDAIKDNYEAPFRFKQELSSTQVKNLLSLYRPCVGSTSAPVAPMPEVGPLRTILPPPKDPFYGIPHGRVAPSVDPRSMPQRMSSIAAPVAPMLEVATPHAILPPPEGRYYGIQNRFAAPMVDPHSTQHQVMSSQRELYGTKATMEHCPTLEHLGLKATNDAFYFPQSQRMNIAGDTAHTVGDIYSRYRAGQEIAPRQLPSTRERECDPRQTNVIGRYHYPPTPAVPHVPPPMHPNGPVSGMPERSATTSFLPVSSYYSFSGAKRIYR